MEPNESENNLKINIAKWAAIIAVCGGCFTGAQFLFAVPNRISNVESSMTELKAKHDKMEQQLIKFEVTLGRVDENVSLLREDIKQNKKAQP